MNCFGTYDNSAVDCNSCSDSNLCASNSSLRFSQSPSLPQRKPSNFMRQGAEKIVDDFLKEEKILDLIKTEEVIDTSLLRVGSIYMIYDEDEDINDGMMAMLYKLNNEYMEFLIPVDYRTYNASITITLDNLKKGQKKIVLYKDFWQWQNEMRKNR